MRCIAWVEDGRKAGHDSILNKVIDRPLFPDGLGASCMEWLAYMRAKPKLNSPGKSRLLSLYY